MSDNDHPDILLDHNYDGIQEYDNPLPGWWSALFAGSTVFAVLYMLYFHSGVEGRSVHDAYGKEAARVFEKRFAAVGELKADGPTIVAYMNDPKWLAVGEAVFRANCVSCHGQAGEGNVGPNLTDDYWKNVTRVEDIAKVIEEGAANGAMPAWRNRLSHVNQVVLTAAYVASLRGSSPTAGKAPEGVPIEPWGAKSASQ